MRLVEQKPNNKAEISGNGVKVVWGTKGTTRHSRRMIKKFDIRGNLLTTCKELSVLGVRFCFARFVPLLGG